MSAVSGVGGGAAEEIAEQYQTGVARKALDVETQEGAGAVQLIAGAAQAAPVASPDGRGAHISVFA